MTEQLKTQIAQGLREYLETQKEAGMSQAKVARLCGVNQPYIGYILAEQWNNVPGSGGAMKSRVTLASGKGRRSWSIHCRRTSAEIARQAAKAPSSSGSHAR